MQTRIKAIRKDLKLTQTEFGERIGVKGNTITGYETGLRSPSDAVITSICREFNVSEAWLRSGEGSMYVELSRDEELAHFFGEISFSDDGSFKRRLMSVLSRLDESEWALLEKMANQLVAEEQKKDRP